MTKICTNCKEDRPIDHFGKCSRNADKINNECKFCNRARANRWAAENKVKNSIRASTWNKENSQRHNEISVKWNVGNKRKKRDTHLKKNFGITIEEYDNLLNVQEGKCAICGNPESTFDGRTKSPKMLSVDHDHITGVVRGLLCQTCNLVLGLFKDSLERFEMAMKYLEKK
jgi:Recombination endonuclease VII